ncbi:MAG: hypothetical protein H3C38_14395 [Rhodospirillales bacterium]|nr:hypothetical protein [Rhodospirillales bacterium]
MNLNSLLRSPMGLCIILMGGLAVVFFAGSGGEATAGAEQPSLWISLLPMLLCVGVHLLMCGGHKHGKDGASCHKDKKTAEAPESTPALVTKPADGG